MSYASYADGPTGGARACRPRSPRRALEIVGIVFAFFWFWPLAAAYIAWKCMGYPVPEGLREPVERVYGAFGGFTPLRDVRWNAAPFTGTGNRAFDEYRRAELERLEQERRRLDDEAREFRSFVEELKRAKDREEFDAYMAKRRAGEGPQPA
jgi:Protein of unknown function (DUF2852)